MDSCKPACELVILSDKNFIYIPVNANFNNILLHCHFIVLPRDLDIYIEMGEFTGMLKVSSLGRIII